MTTDIAKAELHCHLEGAAPPDLVRRLAARNDVALPDGLFTADGGFAWTDFLGFLRAYDQASACIRTPEDYRDVTYEYLVSCAAEGVIYVKLFSSPDHAADAGMTYQDHLDGITQGIVDARAETGIEGRIIVTCVRHLGPERGQVVAEQAVAHPSPYVVGFGMGGDENAYGLADFTRAFAIAYEAGLSCTVHAGEVRGPESIRDALEHLPVRRLGHGVRAIEDPALVEELADRGIALEVCPGSNLALGVFDGPENHPLPRLLAAGVKVSLGSDDPPFFQTSIGREYARAHADLGLDPATLRRITLMALDAAFIDDPLRRELKAKL